MRASSGVTVGVVLVLCSVLLAIVAYRCVHFWMGTPGGPAKTVFYEVRANENPQAVARALQELGVISSARLFHWYGRISGKTRKFKAGDYRFTTRMRPDEVMAVIMSGVSYGIPFTVPEGYSMEQVVEVLETLRPESTEHFLRLCADRKFIASLEFRKPPATLEGYLFPDTYLVGRKMPVEEIIRQMVRKYRAVFTPELSARAAALGLSEHQVVTLASIIEKETGAKSERSLISSVFHNRLKKKMRLQSDPTAIYGIRDYDGNITRRHLETSTPYNTYVIKGLPPGPIGNPGRDAIIAALYPAESDYLYFVSHNDGTHEFTVTYEDHRKAVVKFQLDPKAREGKSWRQLPQNARH